MPVLGAAGAETTAVDGIPDGRQRHFALSWAVEVGADEFSHQIWRSCSRRKRCTTQFPSAVSVGVVSRQVCYIDKTIALTSKSQF